MQLEIYYIIHAQQSAMSETGSRTSDKTRCKIIRIMGALVIILQAYIAERVNLKDLSESTI